LPVPPAVFAIDGQELAFMRVVRDHGIVVQTVRRKPIAAGTFHQGPLGGPARDIEVLQRTVSELIEQVGEVKAATLVLPDRWMRLGFIEITELPAAPEARLAALRFKLKQQVPFRVDDLRISACDVPSLPGQVEPRRLAVAFAAEALLGQLEQAFAAAGVRLGLITNESLALLAALPADGVRVLLVDHMVTGEDSAAAPGERGAARVGATGSYSLLIAAGDEPMLYRFKAVEQSMPADAAERMVRRELKLLRTFLDEKLEQSPVEAAFVVSRYQTDAWLQRLREEMHIDAVALSSSERAVVDGLELPTGWFWPTDGPLLGASLLEVA
jgi:hypothetical protein